FRFIDKISHIFLIIYCFKIDLIYFKKEKIENKKSITLIYSIVIRVRLIVVLYDSFVLKKFLYFFLNKFASF
ncbi:MAG TPA: hypothetical protein DHW82_12160, partial [Spirochaetia bacterium]|nr:hypothetical protein [Spirochaetia bacterium]